MSEQTNIPPPPVATPPARTLAEKEQCPQCGGTGKCRYVAKPEQHITDVCDLCEGRGRIGTDDISQMNEGQRAIFATEIWRRFCNVRSSYSGRLDALAVPDSSCGHEYVKGDMAGGWTCSLCGRSGQMIGGKLVWAEESIRTVRREPLTSLQQPAPVAADGAGHARHALLLGDALRRVLVNAGVLRPDAEVTGPELLLAADDLCRVTVLADDAGAEGAERAERVGDDALNPGDIGDPGREAVSASEFGARVALSFNASSVRSSRAIGRIAEMAAVPLFLRLAAAESRAREAEAMRAERDKLREAIRRAGFAVMQTSGAWDIFDVSEHGKAADAKSLEVATKNVELSVENRRLREGIAESLAMVDEAYQATGYAKIAKTSEQRLRLAALGGGTSA